MQKDRDYGECNHSTSLSIYGVVYQFMEGGEREDGVEGDEREEGIGGDF